MRQFLAKELKLIDPSAHNLLWVTDFPMFEWNEDEQRLEALHHPFTAPNPEDLGSGDLRHARALAYDMVYNGVEIGGGSLRIYRYVHAWQERRGAAGLRIVCVFMIDCVPVTFMPCKKSFFRSKLGDISAYSTSNTRRTADMAGDRGTIYSQQPSASCQSPLLPTACASCTPPPTAYTLPPLLCLHLDALSLLQA